MKFLCALCVLWGLMVPVHALDREAFTFTRYDLNVRVEAGQQRLGVRGKLTLRNDSESAQDNAVLQISSTLNWSSIQLGGQPAEFLSQLYTSDIDHTGALSEAIIAFPRPVAPKQSIELEVGYEGVVPQDVTRLTRIGVPADAAKHSDWDQIGRTFTAVRGIGYVAWYPIATEAANLSETSSVSEEVGRWKEREADAQFDVDLCVTRASGQPIAIALMNAPPQTQGQGGGYDGTTCASHPYRTLRMVVPTFAIADYSQSSKTQVEINYFPNHKSGGDDYALAVEQVTPFVDRWLGGHTSDNHGSADQRSSQEPKAVVVDLPDPDASPFESGNMLLMPLTGNDTSFLLSALRQLTHLAFPSPREWIFDGLPLFVQTAYLEKEKGRAAAISYLQNHRRPLFESEKQNAHSPAEGTAARHSLINSSDEFYVQTKAMNAWWMLRDIVGETALIAAFRNYAAAEDKDAYYMQKLIETQAHLDLSWFFDDWVYRDRGLPDLRIVSVYPRELMSGGYMVTVTIGNLGEPAVEVPVTLKMAASDVADRLMVPGKSKASVRIQAPAMPAEAIVNDGSVPETDMTSHTFRIESKDK